MKIALAGIGKIAHGQHIPALKASPDWELAAAVSRHGVVDGVETFGNLEEMLAARPDIEVVSLCLPPIPRYDYAVAALKAGRHVMLEKPPAASLAEARSLKELAASVDRTLFATWHSRMAPGVAPAKAWLADKTMLRTDIVWREDVRKWHPGQEWVFEAGGMGVFDPGINALSILTEILPQPVTFGSAMLEVPANRTMPIAAKLKLKENIFIELDWRSSENEAWNITVDTPSGFLQLHKGGHELLIDGERVERIWALGEYPTLYARMAALVRKSQSDVDLSPLAIVEDALTRGQTAPVALFDFQGRA